MRSGSAAWGYWGPNPEKYVSWSSHSNRLIPVYTFGIGLDDFQDKNSVYRRQVALQKLYGHLPANTLAPDATYLDQTDIHRLQEAALAAGKTQIILFVFDGMDWQTTWAAATYKAGQVAYREGRGTGLHFQDFQGVETDFGFMVTSPFSGGEDVDPDAQVIRTIEDRSTGGYDPARGGYFPWSRATDPLYIVGKSRQQPHSYTDSASSATSMTSGVKTFNAAINVDRFGQQTLPFAQLVQQLGWGVGIVTSVPISHATPAAAYAQNVSRSDYQDITRDLLGLHSVSHRQLPLPGVDVLLGAGWGEHRDDDASQGRNFIPGNRYWDMSEIDEIDVEQDGQYRIVQRQAGVSGRTALHEAARHAARQGERLFGLFGVERGHLPYQTADGAFDPTVGVSGKAETYTSADVFENPTLADLTSAALTVLESQSQGFWLLVESGDVDWANHDNNLDNSIGAVLSGDEAVHRVTTWVTETQNWEKTALIVTADHGHYLMLTDPGALLRSRGTRRLHGNR